MWTKLFAYCHRQALNITYHLIKASCNKGAVSKGIIYPVRYKELDFTVPEFAGFIQRLDEYKQWKKL